MDLTTTQRVLLLITGAVFGVLAAFSLDAPVPSHSAAASALPTPGRVKQESEVHERERWFYNQRTSSDRKVSANSLLRARKQATALSDASALAASPLNWTELGPHPISSAAVDVSGTRLWWTWGGSLPYSGRVTAIATHPTD